MPCCNLILAGCSCPPAGLLQICHGPVWLAKALEQVLCHCLWQQCCTASATPSTPAQHIATPAASKKSLHPLHETCRAVQQLLHACCGWQPRAVCGPGEEANAHNISSLQSTHAPLHKCYLPCRAILELLRRDIKPRDIMTRKAFENAIVTVMALGGSTNAVLHLLAMAQAVDVPLTLDDFQTISDRTPFIADLKPSGRYVMEDLHKVGKADVFYVVIWLQPQREGLKLCWHHGGSSQGGQRCWILNQRITRGAVKVCWRHGGHPQGGQGCQCLF